MSPTDAPATGSTVSYLLAIADDNLVIAQRLGELVSHMPDLEHDIACANIGLDHLGQARALYGHAADLEGEGRDEDALAMLRDERDFTNAVLVEQPNVDFAHVMARQFFVDAYQVPLYAALSSVADETLAGIAAKAEREARYHLRHSGGWVVRLGDGTDESHRRMQQAVDALWQYTGDLFALGAASRRGVEAGELPDPAQWRAEFDSEVERVLTAATLSLPSDPYQRLGGRDGVHTEHLGHLLTEMQWLYRSHPGVSW